MACPISRRDSLLLLCVLLPCAAGCGGYGTRLQFKSGELYYTKAVTRAEAEKLGQHLVSQKFFDGERKTAQLNKSGDTYEFRMVIKPEFQNDADYERVLAVFASELSLHVFDKAPVAIHVCNDRLKTLRTVEQSAFLAFGPSLVCFTPSVERAEAKKLGEVLDSDGFFASGPKSILLDRSGGVYLLRMTVLPGYENKAEYLAAVKQMRAELSQKAFGNKPLTIQLCSGVGKTIKEFTGD